MISRAVDRGLTQWRVRQAEREHGRFHPVTFAAYGRAFVAWSGRIKPPSDTELRAGETLTDELWAACCRAYTVAQLRAYGSPAHDNHRVRRRTRRLLREMFPRYRAVVK